jgi:nucleoid-associated protein YgaU
MRKEVKLGMTIGGGLIALLVVYMLVAPPSQNKGGALLATNDKGGNIIDNTPTDVTPVSDEKGAAHSSTDSAGGLPLGKVPDVQPTKPSQPEEHEQPAPPTKEKDGWNEALVKGHKLSTETSNSAKDNAAKPAPVTPKSAPKPSTAKPVAAKHETHESHEAVGLATPSQASEAKLYFNPNDAWGGGVSDGVLDTHETPKKKVSSHKEGTETAAAPTGGGGKYVVKSGDTLSSIAQATYGSASYYPHILRANPTVNPNNLKLGTELTLPKAEDVKATDTPREHVAGVASISQDVKIDTTHQYQVQSGDSLYKISLKVYGKSTYVEKIYELNKTTIGLDPKKLKLGMVLELPEKAAVATSGNQGGGEAAEEGQR